MSLFSHARNAASAERGGVLVMFAVFAPVAILFFSFVIDVGNTFWHSRHLQVQADAGALAAARDFQPCVNANIYGRAAEYAGATEATTPSGKAMAFAPLFNTQVGGTSQNNMHVAVNSKTYYKQSSPVDPTAEAKPPCEALMADVKVTETDLPWFVKVFHSVFNGIESSNAHARVEVLQELEPSGVEPLAVAESAPIAARAYFVNEDEGSGVATVEKGKALATVALIKTGVNPLGQDVWSSSSAPLAFAVKQRHTGVVIALSGNAATTKCGDQYVKCFDGASGPLLHIAGYSNAGTGTLAAPIARQVTLSSPPGTCTDGYFSNAATNCTLAISAKVDYGSATTKGMSVLPVVKGAQGPSLTFNAGTGLWSGSATMQGAGSNEISLLVKCNNKTKGSPCEAEKKATEATAANVQRAYAASEAGSGTIAGAWIGEAGGAAQDANSFEICETQNGSSCTHQLTVTVNVVGSLSDAQKFSDPLYHMRFGSSQAEVVGCTPGGESSGAEYREHLASGCNHRYKLNTSDPNCTGATEPYDCIGFASGVKTGPFSQGLEKRFETEPPAGTKFYCPNNWVKSNGEGVPLIPNDDSRVIQLFVEPYDSNGSKSAPIQDFATFYVTGWDGDNCKSKTNPDNEVAKGEVVGHFIKYINTLNTKEGGGPKCALNSLAECVTVLTR